MADSKGRLPLTYWGLVLTYLAVSINLSVTSVALPQIAVDLQASSNQLAWIFNITPLVSAGFMLFAGTWGDRFGRKRILVIGLIVFLGSSLLSATATTAPALIAYRGLTGLGSALAMPAALALTFDLVQENRRRTAVGMLGATQAGGALLGPLIAGAAITAFSWPAAFLTVVPFIALALVGVLAIRIAPVTAPTQALKPDNGGATWMAIFSVGFVYATTMVTSPLGHMFGVVAACLISFIALGFLIRHERHAVNPLFQSQVIRQRAFWLATSVVFSVQLILGGMMFVLTQYLQLALGYSPMAAGLLLTPALLAWLAVSATAGRSSSVLTWRWAVVAGLGVACIGFALLAFQARDATTALLLIGLLMAGCMGVAPALMTTMAVSVYSDQTRNTGSAINGVASRLGFSLGIAVLGGVAHFAYVVNVVGNTGDLPLAERIDVTGFGWAMVVAAVIAGVLAIAVAALGRAIPATTE